MKAMMQDMIRSSLTEYVVIPKAGPTQSQSQSIAVDKETPQVVDLSEGELSDSEQKGSRTPELDQLMLTAEEQMDYDSLALASPSETGAPLWKFAEENPTGSQAQPQAQARNV